MEAKLGMRFLSKHWKETCAAGAESEGRGDLTETKGSSHPHEALGRWMGRRSCLSPFSYSTALGRSLAALNRIPGAQIRFWENSWNSTWNCKKAERDGKGNPRQSPWGKPKLGVQTPNHQHQRWHLVKDARLKYISTYPFFPKSLSLKKKK